MQTFSSFVASFGMVGSMILILCAVDAASHSIDMAAESGLGPATCLLGLLLLSSRSGERNIGD